MTACGRQPYPLAMRARLLLAASACSAASLRPLVGLNPFVQGCSNGCSGQGACYHGLCICELGFTSADCSIRRCPNDCCGNGQCVDGSCSCRAGFGARNSSGPLDCCGRLCASDCGNPSGRGLCDASTGACACAEGWRGERCSLPACPHNCSGHGKCNAASRRCECAEGWAGDSCAEPTCIGGCGANGECVDGSCLCLPGYTGRKCERRRCPNDCSSHGRCALQADGTTACECEVGFAGGSCEARVCANRCSNHGTCTAEATCVCDAGWTGEICATPTCEGALNNCSGHGTVSCSAVTLDACLTCLLCSSSPLLLATHVPPVSESPPLSASLP